jgi:glycosyltransferase involved in cell wall biosynthesis
MSRLPVSVIIPCYNREGRIAAAIESALAEGVEVVVVDDGSTDMSWSVIQSFAGRIKAERITNSGPSAARNKGFSLSTQQYIQFLDSDDVLVPGSMRLAYESSRKLSESEILLAHADWGGMAARSMEEGRIAVPDLLSWPVGTPLPFHKRKAFERAEGFDPELRFAEDHDLVVRLCLLNYTFVSSSLVTCKVGHHSDHRVSRSPDVRLQQRRAHFKIADALAQHGDAKFFAPHARLLWTAGRDAARDRDRQLAEEFFVRAVQLAGRQAWPKNAAIRALYATVGPYRAEHAIQIAKRLLGDSQGQGKHLRQ